MAAAVIKCPAPWLGWKSPEAELGAELGANTQPSSAVPGEAGLMGDRGQQLRSFTGGLLGGLRRHRWLLGGGRGPQRGRRDPRPWDPSAPGRGERAAHPLPLPLCCGGWWLPHAFRVCGSAALGWPLERPEHLSLLSSKPGPHVAAGPTAEAQVPAVPNLSGGGARGGAEARGCDNRGGWCFTGLGTEWSFAGEGSRGPGSK